MCCAAPSKAVMVELFAYLQLGKRRGRGGKEMTVLRNFGSGTIAPTREAGAV